MANAAENERYLEELLSSLKEVQIQSVGMDLSLRKYYEVIDVSASKRVLLIIQPSKYEDLRIKDPKGKTRAKMYGEYDQEGRGQTDIFLDKKSPIGCIKDNVVYDDRLSPLYLSLAKTSLCVGITTSYKLVTESEKIHAGNIEPIEETIMMADFSPSLSWRGKMLILCSAFHYGMTKHLLGITKRIVEPEMFGLRERKSKYISGKKKIIKESIAEERRQSHLAEALLDKEKIQTKALAKEVEEQNKQLFLEARERRRDTEAEVRRSSLVEPRLAVAVTDAARLATDSMETDLEEKHFSEAQKTREDNGDRRHTYAVVNKPPYNLTHPISKSNPTL